MLANQAYQYLLDSNELTNKDKELFTKFLNADINPQEAETFLYLVCCCINTVGKKHLS